MRYVCYQNHFIIIFNKIATNKGYWAQQLRSIVQYWELGGVGVGRIAESSRITR